MMQNPLDFFLWQPTEAANNILKTRIQYRKYLLRDDIITYRQSLNYSLRSKRNLIWS